MGGSYRENFSKIIVIHACPKMLSLRFSDVWGYLEKQSIGVCVCVHIYT